MQLTLSAPFRFRRLRRLLGDSKGVAMLEFAFSAPIVLGIGLYGVEVANLALANLRVSQIALNLADNASRIGARSAMAQYELREVDINDVLQAARLQGDGIDLTERGRITLSTLYHDGTNQRIHWQRCIGKKSGTAYQSHWGSASITDGSDATWENNGALRNEGMGPSGQVVHAPPRSGVVFVEINYQYKPVVSSRWVSADRIQYIASFIVRDRRDFSQIYNPNPAAPRSTCDKFEA